MSEGSSKVVTFWLGDRKVSARTQTGWVSTCHTFAMHLLVVEDDLAIAEPLLAGLRHHGFDGTHVTCGGDAITAISNEGFDVVLLDLGLPDIDGLDVCREIRKLSTVPIIMVTARGEEIDRIVGLELGADDYVSKPFGIRELIARIRAVHRRFDSATGLSAPPNASSEHGAVGSNKTDEVQPVGAAPASESVAIALMPGIRTSPSSPNLLLQADSAKSIDSVTADLARISESGEAVNSSAKPAVGTNGTITTIGALTIDHRTHRVHVDCVEIALTPKEFGLLAVLSSDPGAVVPRMSIIEQVWDEHWYGPTKTLDVHVAQLRQKLGNPAWIETVRGVGYRLASPDLLEPAKEPQ
jgi:DNA-binding response OmpR family regulator